MDGYTILCPADDPDNNCVNAEIAETQGSKTNPHRESNYILWELIA